MKQRFLGRTGAPVSVMGLGCVGMSGWYGAADEAESVKTLERAVELGVTLFDTADSYGRGHNEQLLGRVLGPIAARHGRDKVLIASKFGNSLTPDGRQAGIDGTPENVRRSCDASLQRLGTDHIDLYYLHRVDPNVPIEETVGAMAGLVQAGKVRWLGLSEVSAATLQRACAIHPISAVESEYSLWSRDVEGEILPVCAEMGIAFIAFSPLGRGFLTGGVRSSADLPEGDRRKLFPRFTGANLENNLRLLPALEAVAAEKKCSLAQLSLAWVLSQGENVIAIPGTTRRKHLEENAAAAAITLTAEERDRIRSLVPLEAVAGARYGAETMKKVGV